MPRKLGDRACEFLDATVRPVLLRRRLLLLFVGVVVGVVVLGVLARSVIRSRDEAADRGKIVRVSQEQVNRLHGAYSDQETGERGFVITGDDRFLQPYTAGTRDARQLVRSLRGALDEVPGMRAPLAAVVASADRWRADAAEHEIALVRAGDLAGAAQSVDSGVGQRLFTELRRDLDRLDRTVTQEVVSASDHAADTRRELTSLVVLVIVVLFLGTVVAAWLIRKWVTRPIDHLVEAVRWVRGGEGDASISLTGPPEIAQLADDIDHMRRRIEEQRLVALQAREAVEQNAAVVLALRSQLEPEIGELPAGWTIAAQLRAAEGVVAGDCYDLVQLRNNQLGLIVVDIAGHGATEGILALRCKELMRASLAAGVPPGATIDAVAEQLGQMGPEVFLTAFVAVVDMYDGTVRYANAGHPPAFIASADGNVDLGPTGPLVGLLGSGWETRIGRMEPGDSLCAYTDGLIEIRNAAREFFGPERLQELVRGTRCEEAPVIVKLCLDEAELFAAGRLQDDATVVVLCRSVPARPVSEV